MESRAHRHSLIEALLPYGVPRLWCPTITHYQPDGALDEERIRRHLEVIAPYAKGLLVPGSTGEGWEMDEREVARLLESVLNVAPELDLRILIGVLRKQLQEMLAVIEGTVNRLCDVTGKSSGVAAMIASRVVGFTVCPPTGADLAQAQIEQALSEVLELGYPTALYQLPQVTGNEMAPHTVGRLSGEYPNFYLFKDTSGHDRVAQGDADLHGVILVRGAEGQYASWLRTAGGPYDGFLLSSANCFARELAEMSDRLTAGETHAAADLSMRIERSVLGCFEIVKDFPAANPFTNANKVMDHVMAFGEGCQNVAPPYLRGRRQLPAEFVERAFELLRREKLVPRSGYLQ